MADKHRLEAMLGSARFQKYYEAAAQDVDRAVDLYRWNTRLAGEFHAQLSYFEILLRNAMDSALRDWNFQECGHRDWCVERQTAGLLYEMMSTPLRQARKRALRESKRRGLRTGVSHDDILAQLTMGNWSNLLGEALPVHKSNAKVLWKVGLHRAFPNASSDDQSRKDIGRKVERLTRLRNRVAHQENLLKTNVRSRLHDMLSVLSAIDASYPEWVMKGSQVRKTVREDPRRQW